MSAIFVAMGASFIVAITFLILYLISVKQGQFEDTYTPSVRILFDDEEIEAIQEEESIKKTEDDKNNNSNQNNKNS